MRWTDEQTALLRKLWAEGVSSGAIAKHFGVGRGAVTGKLAREGAAKLTKEEIARRNRIAQRTRFAGTPDSAPAHKPAKPPKPPRIAPTDPAALAAAALLAAADCAQRRRNQMREQRGWGAR